MAIAWKESAGQLCGERVKDNCMEGECGTVANGKIERQLCGGKVRGNCVDFY
jgi:hypothetical protein